VDWTFWTIVPLAAIAGVGVFSFLYTLASRLWWEIRLHELHIETRELRIQHEMRLAEMRRGESVELL